VIDIDTNKTSCLMVAKQANWINTLKLNSADIPISIDSSNSIILDLSEIHYLSGKGLKLLLKFIKEHQQRDSKIILQGLNAYVKELFEVCGFKCNIGFAA